MSSPCPQAYARAVAASTAATTPVAQITRKQAPAPARTAHAQAPAAADDSQSVEAQLLKILELEELDVNMYRGYSPAAPRWGRIYGGQTVAQALVASCRTVDPQYIVHSLHSYFLRPGDDEAPIIYYVERLRNGASFASRRVTALQRGAAIFAMNVSFQTEESGVEHQLPMPPVPPPESVRSLPDTYREIAADPRMPERIRKGLQRSSNFPFTIDLRRAVPATLEERLQPNNPAVHRSWMRVVGQLGNSLMIHQCALAYLSDWSLLETALMPHGLHGWIQRDADTVMQMASIDHAMWFHHAFRADEWLLYDMDSPAASNGRGLATGRFYTRDGKLVVTTAQEGLIRVRSLAKDKQAAAAKKRALAAAKAATAAAAAAASAEEESSQQQSAAAAAASPTAGSSGPPSRKKKQDGQAGGAATGATKPKYLYPIASPSGQSLNEQPPPQQPQQPQQLSSKL